MVKILEIVNAMKELLGGFLMQGLVQMFNEREEWVSILAAGTSLEFIKKYWWPNKVFAIYHKKMSIF